YYTLAKEVNKKDNCEKALNAFQDALSIFSEEEYLEIHSLIIENLDELQDFCKER
ncbi:hypothetical protein LCGC14_2080880, partial [marine sediment metagenome]